MLADRNLDAKQSRSTKRGGHHFHAVHDISFETISSIAPAIPAALPLIARWNSSAVIILNIEISPEAEAGFPRGSVPQVSDVRFLRKKRPLEKAFCPQQIQQDACDKRNPQSGKQLCTCCHKHIYQGESVSCTYMSTFMYLPCGIFIPLRRV